MKGLLRKLRRSWGRYTIRYRTILAFLLTVSGAVLISVTGMAATQYSMSQYHAIAAQVTLANRVVPLLREGIGTEAYYLVAGRSTPETTLLWDDVSRLENTLNQLQEGRNTKDSRQQLRITVRTLNTLKKYCRLQIDQAGESIPLEQQDQTLDQVRSVSSLIYDQVSEYIYLQLDQLEQLDRQIQARAQQVLALNLTALLALLVILGINQYRLDRSISDPIRTLMDNIRRLGEGDFEARADWENKNEITVLNESFNGMVVKLQRLMEQVREDTREREQLELRLTQEQINPHFLYNTLEIIVWLAQSGEKQQLVEVVQSLSRFFRTVLSGGRARITVREELECIRSYLYIQQIRYIDILTYSIEADKDVMDCTVQKLTLQPLVENALVHGIQCKRGGGTIRVRVRRDGADLVLSVSDTGCGIPTEELAAVRSAIATGNAASRGFGLSNIQKRVQLDYGPRYGLAIDSREGEGTEVTLRIRADCGKS